MTASQFLLVDSSVSGKDPLALVDGFTRALEGIDDPDALDAVVLAEIPLLLPCPLMLVGRYLPDTGELLIEQTGNQNAEQVLVAGVRLAHAQPLCPGHESGEAAFHDDHRWSYTPLAAAGYRSGIHTFFPLANGVAGVVSLLRRPASGFTETDRIVAGLVCRHWALAAGRARAERERDADRRALAESEERHRTLLNSLPQRVFFKDRESRYVTVNAAFAKDRGLRPEDVVGKSDDDFSPRDLARKYQADDKRVMETRTAETLEELNVVDGTRRIIETVKAPVVGPDGAVVGMLGLFTDITERKQAEHEREAALQACKEAEERLQTVVSNLPVVVFALDADGVFTFSDGQGLRALGVAPGEVVGRSAWTVYRDVPQTLSHLRRALAGEACAWTTEVAGRFWETQCTPLRDDRGQAAGLIGVSIDVSERNRLQAQVTQTEKLAALGEMVAGVAHELNNPLAVILGNAELLEMHPDSEVCDDARTIRRMTDRATRIVRSLLTFAHRHDTDCRPESLNALVESVLDVCVHKLRTAGVTLTLCLDERAPLVWANDNQIQQIVLNLVNNAEHALRACAQPKRIVVATRVAAADPADNKAGTGMWATLSIEDSGCGIPEEIRGRIFDPFFTTKDVGEGTGLGLSICHGIAEAHGGSLSVHSTVGAGTVFTLALPVFQESETA